MNRETVEEIVVQDLLMALRVAGVTWLSPNGERGRLIHQALARIHWHAWTMFCRADKWGFEPGRKAAFCGMWSVVCPSQITGSYSHFWSLVGQAMWTHGLRDSQRVWSFQMSQQWAKHWIGECLSPDYASFIERYARTMARFINTGR